MRVAAGYPATWVAQDPAGMADVARWYDLLGAELARRGHELALHHDLLYELPDDPDADVRLSHHGRADEVRPGVYHAKKAYLPGWLYCDRMGYGPWSEVARRGAPLYLGPAHDAGVYVRKLVRRLRTANRSKWPQPPLRGGPEGRYVLLAQQVPGDHALDAAWLPQWEVLEVLAEATRHRCRLLVKRHPLDETDGVEGLDRARALRHVEVTDASVHDLLPGADAVVVVNSGVGFEALLYGRCVVACGVTDYAGASYATPTETALRHVIRRVSRGESVLLGHHPEMVYQFVAWFLREYLVEAEEAAIARLVDRFEREVATCSGS